MGGFGILAWVFNGLLLVASTFGTLLVLDARQRLPSELQAASVDDKTWYEAVLEAFLLSLLQSFLLVDLVKALCLTLTSEPILARVGLRKPGGKAFAKPIRRLHTMLDLLL